MPRTSHTFAGTSLILGLALGLVTTAHALTLTNPSKLGTRDIEATAALGPVGAASGWGRIEVRETGAVVEAQIMLFGLQPHSTYSIVLDGTTLASVMTDGAGDALSALGSRDDSRPPVPSSMPPTALLRSAAAVDASASWVLEGSFAMTSPSGSGSGSDPGSIYQERITLDDPAVTGASGMAKVERNQDGSQELSTRASGLETGRAYSIVVDGIAAGIVTADMVGQASLELEAPDDSNPLPASLQPIEGLRQVSWIDDGGQTLLVGSFTGVSDPDPGDDGDGSFDGFILGLTATGFTMAVGGSDYDVVVTPTTMFEDVSGVDGLSIGDAVEVHGVLAGTTLTATRVELRNGDDNGGDDDGNDDNGGDDDGNDDNGGDDNGDDDNGGGGNDDDDDDNGGGT